MPRPQILDQYGKPMQVDRSGGMRAKVDAAQTTTENVRHWANADALSADASYDPGVRRTLRNRARYEAINNGYAKGSVRSSANDLVGTGPRLQLTCVPGPDGEHMEEAAQAIERAYQDWVDETQLAIDLHVTQKSHDRDGGCFGLFDTDEDLEHPVKLYVRWVEDELCTSPWGLPADAYTVDGIRFNRLGKPVTYWFLKYHPGGPQTFGSLSYSKDSHVAVPARQVIHWFPKDRHGQHRGIPEMTPALPLYSQLRRYTLATLTAAEFAAMLAGVMKSALPEESDPEQLHTLDQIPRFELIELVRGALLTLPTGWSAEQFKAEQPTTTYPMFKQELLNETGRASFQPLNVVTGNSSGYNYSSGRLDYLPYQRDKKIQRNNMRLIVLDRIWREWAIEARAVGLIPSEAGNLADWRWSWNWDGFDSIDQVKDAQADDMRLLNKTQSLAETFAAYGQDWREQADQIAREVAYFESMGLKHPAAIENKPAPASPEQAVESALEEGDIPEDERGAIMQALGPVFAKLRGRGVNGVALNGKH